ncbi:hypothetical protein CIK05_08665 [Bdellovibrio sp. qaytius]|nr:hypothetical protein CIK05_08665 [Bdellovibrio sp. qaytius]
MKEIIFLTLYAADFVVFKGVLKLSTWRALWIWLVISIISGLIIYTLVFNAPLVWPQVSNSFAFRGTQAFVYGLIEFLVRALFLKILFKIRLFQSQFWLLLALCLAINFAFVFLQVYTPR